MHSLPPALSPLGAWPQFVTWFAMPHPTNPGKFNKFPCSWLTGEVIDAHDRQHWTSAACALAMASKWDKGYGAGAGFVFTEDDPYFFHDIDGAWDGSAWSPLATEILAWFPGCAVEVSHSGRGLHVIGQARKIDHACKNIPLHLELYTSGRFVALTGTHAQGNVNTDASAGVQWLVNAYFPPAVGLEWGAGWTTEPVEGWAGPEDDDALLQKAFAAASRTPGAVFGGATDPSFVDLWEARVDVLAARWPGEGLKPFDGSSADMALANNLAFWTGKDCERIERLMRRSALAREKWDHHRTYLADTIIKACSFVRNVYAQTPAGAKASAPVIPVPDHETMVATAAETGRELREAYREYMGPHDQLTFFAGCFFDNRTETVFSLPKNSAFKKAAFDVNYGGHMFVMDPGGAKTTDSAWEAYTKSRVNKPVIVDYMCFRPEHAPGELIREGSRLLANSYVPYTAPRIEGDPFPFMRHLAIILPNERDRLIILSYMAALIQYPGRKFQWWPVIQGAEGNGKSLIAMIMRHIVGREYAHQPNTQKLAREGMNFNSWLYRKLLIVFEEIYVANRRDLLEELKVIVTGEDVEIERKGQDQFEADNRANGVMLTNHTDGVPITIDSRRYAVFFCPQQTAEDCVAAGLTEAYFADLIDWLKGRGKYARMGVAYGCAVVADYLAKMAIPDELNPATQAVRAPKSSTHELALIASFGKAEQEIMNAVEEGRQGFMGGWVSSFYLDQLLGQIGAHVQRNKRPAMMRTLGYVPHPALVNGRPNDPVLPDMGKPRLYVKAGHPAMNLISPADVGRAYSRAQEPVPADQSAKAALVFKPPA